MRQIRRVHPAERFKRRTDAQQPDPLQIFAGIVRVLAQKNLPLVHIQQRRDRPRSLQVPSHAAERATPRHGSALYPLRPGTDARLDDGRQKFRQISLRRLRRPQPADLVEQPIEPLPLLGADFVANLPRIFARRKDARGNRRMPRRVEAQGVYQRRNARPTAPARPACRSASLVHPMPLRRSHCGKHPLPAPSALTRDRSSISPMLMSISRAVCSARSR